VGVIAAIATAAVLAWRARRAPRAHGALLALVAATALAVLALSPYLAAITAGKQGQLAVQLSRGSVVSFVWAGALVVPAGLAALVVRARRDPGAAGLLAAVVPLAVLALVLKLPENNQSKFVNLLLLLLAAPAALAWHDVWMRARGLARPALVAGGAVLALPTAGFAIAAFAMERGQSAGSWHAPPAPTAEAMAWARAHTPPDAAFADLAGAADIVALAGRSVLWGGPRGERDWGGARDALQARRLAVLALARGMEPAPAERSVVASLARPVVVVARSGDAGDPRSGWNVLPGAPGFRELHRTATVAFFAWEGGR
jgi:hypothetical protein